MNGIFVHTYSVNFRHSKFGQNVLPNGCYFVIKITVKWSVCVRTSFVVSPPPIHPDGPNRCARIKTKLLKFVPRFWLLLLLRLLLSMPMLCVCVLVAHMACSNKIMEFHTGEIEIEKSLFKTFMYAHWCDLIGTLTISPARFFNVLCLCLTVCLVFYFIFQHHFFVLSSCNANNKQLDSVVVQTANGGCVLSICYHRKFFTKLLSFLPMFCHIPRVMGMG